MTIECKDVPEGKGKQENLDKFAKLANEKNEKIAKLFGVKPSTTVKANLYHSSGAISGKMFSQERDFKGYVDGSEEVMVIHPEAADGLFTDLWAEMDLITEFVFVKYYLCKKYYPEKKDFKLYYKYVADVLADVVSGKFHNKVARFEFKMYFPGKKLKKEVELGLMFHIMKENSGLEFIFSHLDKIMEDCDIGKTMKDIYNKTQDELLLPIKKKTEEEDKKIEELEKQRRREIYNANRKNFNTSNAQRQSGQKKFVTRDKFKPGEPRPFKRKPTNYRTPEQRAAEAKAAKENGEAPKSKFGYSKLKSVSETQQKDKKEYVSKPKMN